MTSSPRDCHDFFLGLVNPGEVAAVPGGRGNCENDKMLVVSESAVDEEMLLPLCDVVRGQSSKSYEGWRLMVRWTKADRRKQSRSLYFRSVNAAERCMCVRDDLCSKTQTDNSTV